MLGTNDIRYLYDLLIRNSYAPKRAIPDEKVDIKDKSTI